MGMRPYLGSSKTNSDFIGVKAINSPQPPDPYATAAAQNQQTKQAAVTQQEMNMVDQSNPYGSLTYSQNGTNPDGTPKYSSNISLTPQTQALFDQYQTLTGQRQGLGQSTTGLAQTYLNNGQGALSGKGPDLSYNGTAASLDALNRARLDPQWAQAQDQQESKLASQGVTPGTPAYDNAMRVFNQAKNDAYNSANLADYQTAANTALSQWNAPLQAFGSLVGYGGQAGGNGPTMPSFQSTPTVNVPATNIAGLTEQNYQQQVAQNNATMGGLFGLAGTIGGAALGGPMGAGMGKTLGTSLGNMFMGGGSPSGYGTGR